MGERAWKSKNTYPHPNNRIKSACGSVATAVWACPHIMAKPAAAEAGPSSSGEPETTQPAPSPRLPMKPHSVTGTVDPVPMDGNCLFSSALLELQRLGLADAADARELRAKIMEWIEKYGADTECAELSLATWIEFETEEELPQYVHRLRRNGEWGGIIELYALTEMYGVTINVWEPVGSDRSGRVAYSRRHSLESGGSASSNRSSRSNESGAEGPAAHLYYNGSTHYCRFLPDLPPNCTARKPTAVAGRDAAAGCTANENSSAAANCTTISRPTTRSDSRSSTARNREGVRGTSVSASSRALSHTAGISSHRVGTASVHTEGGVRRIAARSTRAAAARGEAAVTRHSGAIAAVKPRALGTLPPGGGRAGSARLHSKRSLGELGENVKLRFRFRQGGGLPPHRSTLREVRV